MRNNQVILFENFKSDTVKLDFEDSSKSFKTSLYNRPGDFEKDHELENLNIKFSILIQTDKTGISSMTLKVEEIRFSIKVTTYLSKSGDLVEEEELEYVETDFSNQEEFVTVEMYQLPFYIQDISIDMGQSLNKENFKYWIEIGKRNY